MARDPSVRRAERCGWNGGRCLVIDLPVAPFHAYLGSCMAKAMLRPSALRRECRHCIEVRS